MKKVKPENDAFKEWKDRLEQEDEQKRKEGFTWKVFAWIHSWHGGDDRYIVEYFRSRPTDKYVRALLIRYGSADLEDFKVTRLNEGVTQ
jgi:hypothetical protein